MKTLVVAAIRCFLISLVPSVTYAISPQWDLDPISGDWNTAANWTPNRVPNGPSDIATFGLSNTSDVSISANTEVNSIVFIPAATNPYTITASPGLTLTISGVGIVNNSGRTQGFLTSDASGNAGTIIFSHHASAGSNVSISNNQGSGSTNFYDGSTAGNAFIENSELDGISGSTNFFDHSTAGTSTIESFGGYTSFHDHSTAGSATIIADLSNQVIFADHSTAGSAEFFAGDQVFLSFADHSSAGSASIAFGDEAFFSGSSTAGNATIVSEGLLVFVDAATGGTAGISLVPCCDFEHTGTLDISGHNAPGLTIGSLAGEAHVEPNSLVFLGANNLTVGSNNLSTTFAGVIQDGGLVTNGGTGGSLTKIGTGTLTLTGANTYTGDTNVNRGVLQVDGSITSNTFVNHGGTLAGAGTVDGNVTNSGRVSPGSIATPGMLTVTANYTQAQYATLMIQIAGANTGDFSVLNVLGTANLSGQLDPVLLNGFLPTVGETFTFLNYGAVNGTLFMFNRNIDSLPEHWDISYFPTFAVLTVAAGNVSVPDQGSTFVLLTLGLLGLVTYRRQLLRGQVLSVARVNYWEIIADNLSKAGCSGAMSPRLIPTGERSEVLTHVATMESVSSCVRIKS